MATAAVADRGDNNECLRFKLPSPLHHFSLSPPLPLSPCRVIRLSRPDCFGSFLSKVIEILFK